MENTLRSRFKSAWNVFFNKDPTRDFRDTGPGYSYRQDRPRLSRGNERSIVTAIYNRIALDVAALSFKHVQLDENGRFLHAVEKSTLNECLQVEANIDQSGHAFIQDVVMSMLDEGSVAIVPTETDRDIESDRFDIYSMRTGKIVEWYPQHVKVNVYNEWKGIHEEIKLHKRSIAIIENPMFAVMNEPNSTMQRLIRKLNLLDVIDEQNSSGKLDLIIQLPYVIKSEARKKQADKRRKEIEDQLTGSRYGIAYTDGTERITQLNRPVENNLMGQIEYLTSMLYSQLGMNQSVLDGTATETTMLNYDNRTIDVIATAIVDAMKRSFLTKTARTQNKSIMYFRNHFRLVPISQLAEATDKFRRNEVMSANEVRQFMGMSPSSDPKADELRNSNMPQKDETAAGPPVNQKNTEENQNENV